MKQDIREHEFKWRGFLVGIHFAACLGPPGGLAVQWTAFGRNQAFCAQNREYLPNTSVSDTPLIRAVAAEILRKLRSVVRRAL